MEANETFTVSVVSTNTTGDVITFNPASQSGLIQDTTSKINMTIILDMEKKQYIDTSIYPNKYLACG